MSDPVRDKVFVALKNASEIVYGQNNLLEAIIAALVCEGHLLIEGLPGLGKTLSVSTLSKLCDLTFHRIQFTPDLLPSDLIGTMIYNQSKDQFHTKFGPIFTQILLADEINRSPAKVQSALLEAMAERQVTIGESTHKLTRPFVVLATQNPIEQEGTYNLPEAQLDRFMMKISVEYPDFEAEKNILGLKSQALESLRAVLSTDDLIFVQDQIENLYVDEKIKNLIVRIVHATRPQSQQFNRKYHGAVLVGASPRATQWLFKLGKFKAWLEGKDFVTPEHVLSVVPDVLGHRMIMTYEANLDKMNSRQVAMEIAKAVV